MSQPATPRDWRTLALLAIVALSIALRALLWHGSSAVPPGDPEEYYRAALHILQGGYHDTGKWLRPPGYPALLAGLLAISGMRVDVALLLQAVLIGLGTLAFYALGRQLFGPAEGLLAAAVAATLVPLAAFAPAMYAEAPFVTLAVLGLAALDRAMVSRRWRWALAAGLLLAAATLTRAVGLFFIPAATLLLAVPRTNDQGPKQYRPSRLLVFHPLSLAMPAALLLGAALLIGPWAARNYAAHGRLILVDTNGGISMWWGLVRSPEEKAARDAELFAVPNLADRQALALRWALERAREDPAEALARARLKLSSLLLLQTRSYAVGDVISLDPRGEALVQNAGELPLGLTLLADAQYLLVMLLGIAGICFAPSWRQRLPALLWVALAAGLAAVTIGHPRLRLPIVAALLPFCAFAILRLPSAIRAPRSVYNRLRRDVRAYAALAGCLVFLALIASARYIPWLRGEWHALTARQQLVAEDPGGARRSLEAARAADPTNALREVALADLELREGRLAEADAHYRAALELEGRSLYSRAMRALLAPALGQPEVAESELAAFDGYWRVRDDLYQWAWRHALAPPPERLSPGDSLALGQYAGFAPATPDLPRGRWTLGDGRLRLMGGCGTLVLRLQGPPGRAATVDVAGAGAPVAVTLTGAPQEIRVPLGGVSGCDSGAPVEARVRSGTGLLDLERAPWFVGVAVIEARVEQ